VVDVSARGDAHISFLCGLLWPFIDSYFVMALALHQLQQDKMQRDLLLQKAQWLATVRTEKQQRGEDERRGYIGAAHNTKAKRRGGSVAQ